MHKDYVIYYATTKPMFRVKRYIIKIITNGRSCPAGDWVFALQKKTPIILFQAILLKSY